MRAHVFAPILAAILVAGGVGAMASACSVSADDAGFAPGDAAASDTADDSTIQTFEVGDDANSSLDYCGDVQLCDPDVPAICMVQVTDAGADTGATSDTFGFGDTSADTSTEDASATFDAPNETGAGTTSACRVIRRPGEIQQKIAACAPAGKVNTGSFCKSDDECAPGLACVGPMDEGRCLKFCCAAYKDPTHAPDAGVTNAYCTLRPLAARPMDKVPVWVTLDNCTLLDDALQCPEGSTCTVVTNDGRTTCITAGKGRDYASCAEDACDKGYVCLGSVDRRCRKLCRLSDGTAACAGGAYCQKTPTIPEGFGICTGGDAGS